VVAVVEADPPAAPAPVPASARAVVSEAAPAPAPRRVSPPSAAPPAPSAPWDEDPDEEDVSNAVATSEPDAGPLTIVSHAREIERAMREAVVPVERAPAVPLRHPNGAAPARPLELPSTELLAPPPTARVGFDEAQLRATADRLIQTLTDYSIDGRVMEIHPGPVVTTYEVLPAAGTKLSKIVRLSDDLAMSLEASKVRIVAPIPGKGRVGFEIPNAVRQTVFFREMVETEAFQKLGGALPVALGKDVVGAPFYADLATMPHLIVAGATGAGKSVGLNVMLTSLLYKRGPEDVRLLMIDPKMVELAVYDGIPHMLLPVVTDMKKATLALRWVVDEMERRYHLFAQTGSRNITTYNERVAKALAEDKPLRGADGPVRMKQTGTTVAVGEGEAHPSPERPQKLPYILAVVDEFADLIMVAGKDIEAAVARLAQKARAAGIHVILATQRPSVDVITGMIKANFPARIAFKVSQRVDSRTILDQQGAEHLLGRGDMLILPPGASDLRRVHCAFVSEDEVQKVTDHWRAQGQPTYDEDILKPRDDEEEGGGDNGPAEIKVPQEKYERAVNLVITSRKCSVSYVQRYLGIGYNVAARIVDKMEREGIVGPPKGPGKEREVLG
jgi:S-DNA-T family DNA segregation ATPase FtsK/SpoIIIE